MVNTSRKHLGQSGGDVAFSKAWLRFQDPSIEKRFRTDYLEHNLNLHRFCHLAAIFFYALFAIWDFTVISPGRMTAWLWVLGVVSFVFFVGLASSYLYKQLYAYFWPYLFVLYVIVTAMGFAVVTIYDRPHYSVYNFVGLIFCLLFCYTLIRLYFYWAVFAGNVIVGIYFLLVWHYVDPPIIVIMTGFFLTFGVNLLCMVVCYAMEFAFRNDFVMRELLNKAKAEANNTNVRLEKMVEQRTVQLKKANEGLRDAFERKRELVRQLKANEAELRSSISSLHLAEEIALLGYFERNWQTGEEYWSPGLYGLLGLESKNTKPSYKEFNKYVHPDDLDSVEGHLKETLNQHQTLGIEFRFVRKDGSTIHVKCIGENSYDDEGKSLLTRGTCQDITEYKNTEANRLKLESQIRQSQKMEAIGTLAGGIAHDFNNILAAIMGYSELVLDDLPPDSEVAENLKTVIIAANRAKGLTQQILSFSRQTEHKLVPLDLEPLIKEILKMLRATLPSTIEIKQSLPASTGEIMADPMQIHQILMNLCTNAAQAMEESGGVLRVELETVDFDDLTADGYVELVPGKYLRLSVGDTGVGMEKETLDRIFEPFYTTKEVGKGTGMGLSVVHGIVKNYGGTVTVYSEPGQGSTFHVYLPLDSGKRTNEPALFAGGLPRGSENILFVDDEPTLVDIGKKTLSRLGYQVQGFTSAQEALEAFKASPEYFNLLITDYTMPKMTGAQLAKEVLAVKTDTPIIMCTGFSERINSVSAQKAGVARLVMKPLMPREIARIVREVLDSP